MAYHEFAWFYDEFNGEADYDALFAYVTGELRAHGVGAGPRLWYRGPDADADAGRV